jgi:uncharacterized protein (TIGR03000 family)
MRKHTSRVGRPSGGRSILAAGLLTLALAAGIVIEVQSAAPIDAPRSVEPRVPAAKNLSFPGLLSSKGTGQPFGRVELNDTLYSRDVLVAIPGLKVNIEPTSKAVSLTLWGHLPGLSDSPVLESSVILHDSRAYDLDFTLVRGRVVLTNMKKDGAAKVWLRADTGGVDLGLPEPGDSVAIELYGRWPAGVPFSLKPTSAPVRVWEVYCLKGRLEIKAGQTEWGMAAPPGPAYFHGNSVDGPSPGGPQRRATLPDWASPNAKPSPLAKKIRLVLATYVGKLNTTDPDELAAGLLVLAENDKDPERAATLRQMVISALAAGDEVGKVAQILNTSKHEDARQAAVVSLRHWIGAREGRDEKLYEILQSQLGFSKNEAVTVMDLLHSPFAADQPETYETLIAYLKHRRQAVRELAAWHLYRLAPAGHKIAFDASASAAEREKAADEWKKLIPAGELPKQPGDETKPAGKEKTPATEEAPAKKNTSAGGKVTKRGNVPAGEQVTGDMQPAKLVVRVLPGATLTVDDEATTQDGEVRHFRTPALKPGQRYFYIVKASWTRDPSTIIERTRKAYVEAGKTTELDMRTEDSAQPDNVLRVSTRKVKSSERR